VSGRRRANVHDPLARTSSIGQLNLIELSVGRPALVVLAPVSVLARLPFGCGQTNSWFARLAPIGVQAPEWPAGLERTADAEAVPSRAYVRERSPSYETRHVESCISARIVVN
jgi:hypothetical protein